MYDFIIEIFVMLVVEIVFCGIGEFIIPVLSFGKAESSGKVEREDEDHVPPICWRKNGKVIFSHNATIIIGLLSLTASIVALCYLVKAL